jgi:multimeric flavodoxin WrbA
MNGTTRILTINGSYRTGGITDQAVDRISEELQALGADVEHVRLRDYPIGFCLNCRQCMQQPGDAPGHCVQDDAMAALLDKIERADGLVLAAPTNFSSVTAIYKRFMERLAVYGYWPFGTNAPIDRKAKAPKKPVLTISSCAAPASLAPFMYDTQKSLKMTAKTIGGKVVGSMTTGLISQEHDATLPGRATRKIRRLTPRLVA